MPGNDLPYGWEVRELEEVCLSTERRDPSKQGEGEFAYVEISGVDGTQGRISSPRILGTKNAPSRARKVIRAHDVIFATTRPNLKRIALVPDSLDDEICSTGFCVLRANPDFVLPEWIFWACRSRIVLDQVLPLMRGASYPAVTDNDVLSAKLPVPSLPEQRGIVDYIEELMGRIEEVREFRGGIQKDMDDLTREAMSNVFSKSENWGRQQIADVVDDMKSGFACAKKNATASGVPHLRPYNIGLDGELDMSQLLRFPPDLVDLNVYGLLSGDILFNNTNSVELVGKSAIVAQNLQAGFSNHLTRIRVRREIVEPEWLLYRLRNLWQGRVFERNCHRWIGQAGFNSRELLELEVPIPSIAEQRRIISYIKPIQSRAVEFQHLLGQTDGDLDELADAVLEKAFKLHTFYDVLAEGDQVLGVERDTSRGRGLWPAQETLSRYTSSE